MHVFSSVNFIVHKILESFIRPIKSPAQWRRRRPGRAPCGTVQRGLVRGGAAAQRAPRPPPPERSPPHKGYCFIFYRGGCILSLDRHATHKMTNFRRPDARARGGRKQCATAEREDAAGRRQQGARTINTLGKEKDPTTRPSRSKPSRHPPFFFVPQPTGTARYFIKWRAGHFLRHPPRRPVLFGHEWLPNSLFWAPSAWWL